jgi:hypothetical protein
MANGDSKELTMLAKHARSLNITYTHVTAFCSRHDQNMTSAFLWILQAA